MTTISKLKLHELAETKKLLQKTWEETYSSIYPKEHLQTVADTWHHPINLALQSQDPSTLFAVAKNDKGQIVGLITAQIVEEIVHIHRLYVHPTSQKQGIGTKLLEETTKHFPQAKKMKLKVEAKNTKATNFYRKKGFEVVEQEEEIITETITTTILHLEKPLP